MENEYEFGDNDDFPSQILLKKEKGHSLSSLIKKIK